MYDSDNEVVSKVMLAIDFYEKGKLQKARKLHLETLLTKQLFAQYCYYQFLLKVGEVDQANSLFRELLEKKFPPAIVRAGIHELQENKELGHKPELLTSLAHVAKGGHIIAKKLILKHKLITSPPWCWGKILYKIWKLGKEQKRIEADSSLSNELIWF